MADFFDRVYDLVAQIPPGKVATYGQLALMPGNPRWARRVGQAMCHAQGGRKLPCHRVIRARGELPPAQLFGGRQREMLIAEGVAFLPAGCVDMGRCQWPGPVQHVPANSTGM